MLSAYQRAFKDVFEVITAETPEHAALFVDTVDIILSDWHLSTCTAQEFLQQHPDKPTVVVTGCPNEVGIDHAKFILPKPSSMAEIKSALQKALGA
jgi:hypothetical protein